MSLQFSHDDIEVLLNAEYSKRDTFSVLAAAYPSLNAQFKFHVDHIFPRSGFYKTKLRQLGVPTELIDKYQDMFNQLPNLQLLEGVVNQVKTDTEFDVWIRPLRETPDKTAWNQYRTLHVIPEMESYSLHNFEVFFNNRRADLRARLKRELSFVPQEGTIAAATMEPVA